MISKYELPEFVGQLIDIFEDFLEERNVVLENSEREEDEDAAIIYGTDYGELQSAIEFMLDAWHLVKNFD